MSLIKAIAVFPSQPNKTSIKGSIEFTESSRSNNIIIDIHLSGIKPGKHGFHIHETGNLLDDCKSCKSHFNPFGKNHGGPKSIERHVGDLGNLKANLNATAGALQLVNQLLADIDVKKEPMPAEKQEALNLATS